jgi:WD40 repeat protein
MRTSVVNGDEDYGFGYGALSPDGKTVAVGDFSRLNFWEVGSNKLVRAIALPGWWGRQPVFSPDGALVAIAIDNAIGLFAVATGKRLHHDDRTPIGSVHSAAWSPDGDRIVTGHYDGFVRSWNSQTGTLVWCRELAPVISLSGHRAGPAYVGFTPDGKSVVVAGIRDEPVKFRDGIIAVLEADTGNLTRNIALKRNHYGALSPDGQTIAAAASNGAADDTHVFAFDVATGKSLFVTPPEEQRGGFWQVSAIQFRADSQELLFATGIGEVFRFDAKTGREKQKFVADYRTPQQIQTGKPKYPSHARGAFSIDGKTLVTSADDWIYVWDVDTGKLRTRFRHPYEQGCNVCLAPDGNTLATCDIFYAGVSGGDSIWLCDINTGDDLLTLGLAGDRAGVMSFSPDGKRLFTGFHRGSAIVWDVSR